MGSQAACPIQTYYYVDTDGVQRMRYGSIHRNTLFLTDEESRARELNQIIQDELRNILPSRRYIEAKKLLAVLAPGHGFKPYFGNKFVE